MARHCLRSGAGGDRKHPETPSTATATRGHRPHCRGLEHVRWRSQWGLLPRSGLRARGRRLFGNAAVVLMLRIVVFFLEQVLSEAFPQIIVGRIGRNYVEAVCGQVIGEWWGMLKAKHGGGVQLVVVEVVLLLALKGEGVVESMRGGFGRRGGEGGAAAAEGDVEGGVVGWDGAGTGGGKDGRLSLLEQPLYGLAIGLVAKFTGELEDSGGARGRHADAPAPAFYLGVTVL
ncbi:hypothetical protein HPP92_015520 [Vanilla planifolia]|uniref:Uncharacterized protein n=1 Tax=Vanilla planifolia TaxID=51239 RepID=A0A835QEG1_VANPL|nr:hypothetical protein HPP92_015520 [Vanilla planifolia]